MSCSPVAEGPVLNLAHNLDLLAFNFREEALNGRTPTKWQTERYIEGTVKGDEKASWALTHLYRGLVAATVFPYTTPHTHKDDLLMHGEEALAKAAAAYPRQQAEFSDIVIMMIEQTLDPEGVDKDDISLKPTDRVLREISDLGIVRAQLETNQNLLSSLNSRQAESVAFLPLRRKRIAYHLGITSVDVNKHLERAKDRAGFKDETMTAYALDLQNQGFDFGIKKPVLNLAEIYTPEELEIGRLLELPYDRIADWLDYQNTKDLSDKITRMRRKIGAHTVIELALIMAAYDPGTDTDGQKQKLATAIGVDSLEGYNLEDLLSSLTPFQRQVIELRFLQGKPVTWDEIGKQLGSTKGNVCTSSQRAVLRLSKQVSTITGS